MTTLSQPDISLSESLKTRLGASYIPDWEYQLIFPSSFHVKKRDGWKLIKENADEILGQELIIVGKPKI